jgi:XTP/dITP diphosphohydrolase
MTDLWIASGNTGKRRELERLLAPLGYRIRSIDDAPGPVAIVEDGTTFAQNAATKARALAVAVSALAVGDDSGLCVDALGGRPGVHSARYAGPGATDAERIEKLLDELDGVEDRRAHFTCHVCLAGPGGELLRTIEAHCHGRILETPSGSGGFGYDPVFVPDEFAGKDPELSFADLSAEQKDAISHRGRALSQLIELLSGPGFATSET